MLHLTNTATGAKEAFAPLDGKTARLYACGPTVYNHAHIGNFSTYIFNDLLKRSLRFLEIPVRHVMNITDVDDKMIRKSQELGITMQALAEKYTTIFLDEMRQLNIEPPDTLCMATDHIPEMIALTEALIAKSAAYVRDGSVYFSIAAFPAYGKFAHLNPEALANSSRPSSAADEAYEKEDVRDFALWKAWTKDDGDVAWDSPWGRGRPGWHIECSAMSMKYLGESFDLHTGALDLIFPHHQNEIAQSEAATGKPFVRTWLHRGFLTMGDAEKMAKRDGNVLLLPDVAKTPFEALAFRLLVLSSHYRSPLVYSADTFAMHKKNLLRLVELADALENATGPEGVNTELAPLIERTRSAFTAAIEDDLNMPEAFAALFEFVRATNAQLAKPGLSTADAATARALLSELDQVLGVIDVALPLWRESTQPTAEELEKIARLQELRAAKDFAAADALRAELIAAGLDLLISKEGIVARRVV